MHRAVDANPEARAALAVTQRNPGPAYRWIEAGPNGPDLAGVSDAAVEICLVENPGLWHEDALGSGLREVMRVLRPGGLLRVSTPDLDTIIYAYLLDRTSASGPSRAAQLNAWRRSTTAWFVFNEEDLRAALAGAGFVDLRRFIAGSGSDPLFWGAEEADASALVIEARKPRTAR